MGLRLRGAVVFFVLLMILSGSAGAARGQVGINIYGASYHFNTEPEDGIRSFNPGGGLHWTFDRGRRAALELSAGFYRDSFAKPNTHWALGGRFRLLGPFELGAQLVRAESESLLRGIPHMGVLPFFTVRGRRLAVHGVYMPEIDGVNRIRTLGFMATVYPVGRGWDWDRRDDLAAGGGRALEFRIGSGLALERRGGFGLAWRHMFDEHHGLRLGASISGEFAETRSRGNENDRTAYAAALSVQYFRSLVRPGRVDPFWTVGVRTEFSSISWPGHRGDRVEEAIVIGAGVEYELGGGWRLLGEFELAYAFMSEFRGDYFENDQRHHDHLEQGVHLGIVTGFGGDLAGESGNR
ncbi:MAG: hypothetical protein GY838_03300 [bacterium]|nr:hypothetical protein [bacterium]